MKNSASLFFLTLSLLWISACASSKGFDRELLRAHAAGASIAAETENANAPTPHLPNQFKLGIYLRSPYSAASSQPWTWSSEDQEKLLSFKTELPGQITDTFIISNPTGADLSLDKVREAAKKQGADAILMVNGASQADRYETKWAFTYVLLFPAVMIPASQLDVLFLTNAGLYDVKTGFRYLKAEGESLQTQTVPFVWRQEAPLLKKAKEASISRVIDEVVGRFRPTAP